MHCIEIHDELKMFNQYTNDYRETNSVRYKDFNEFSPYNISDIMDFADNYSWEGDRKGLVGVLREYAQQLGATTETSANISLLEQENTIAVMTGHQPALLGGSLFVLLKIASVISLCRKLNNKLGLKRFVPVFWAATEDHNVSEYTGIEVYDKTNDLSSYKYSDDSENIIASARNAITGEQLSEFFSALPQTEFLPRIKDEVYAASADNLGESFCRLINKWFGEFGLIIIEPECLRELSSKIMCKAIMKHKTLVSNMHTDTVEMEQNGYSAQLPDSDAENTFLFYISNGVRHRIKFIEEQFCIPELNLNFTESELLAEVAVKPEKFSPVAGLRPIIQGNVLPACIYIAGGGELAYHYQLRRNFNAMEVSIPLLIPRMSGTFLTPSIIRLLDKFSISYKDILSGDVDWEKVEKKLLAANTGLNQVFSLYYGSVERAGTELLDTLQNMGITNIRDVEQESVKFLERLQRVQNRLSQQNTPIGKDAKKQFFKMYKYLFPKEKYQELSIAGIYFYNLLGKSFFAKICEADVLTNDHKLWIFE